MGSQTRHVSIITCAAKNGRRVPLELTMEVLSTSPNSPPSNAPVKLFMLFTKHIVSLRLCAAPIKAVVIHDKAKQLPSLSISKRVPSYHLPRSQMAGLVDFHSVATFRSDRSDF